jgi:hypothetical protein
MVIGTITCIFYLLFVYHVYFCIAVGDTITKKETLEITCSGLTYLFDMDFYNHIRWWCCVYNALRCWISLFELSFYCCFVCSDLRWEAIFVECRCLRFLFIISQRSFNTSKQCTHSTTIWYDYSIPYRTNMLNQNKWSLTSPSWWLYLQRQYRNKHDKQTINKKYM